MLLQLYKLLCDWPTLSRFRVSLNNESKNYRTIGTSLQGNRIIKQNSDMCVLICVVNRLFWAVFIGIIYMMYEFKSTKLENFCYSAVMYLRVCPWKSPCRRWYSSNHRFRSNLTQMLVLVWKWLWRKLRLKYFILFKLGGPPLKMAVCH